MMKPHWKSSVAKSGVSVRPTLAMQYCSRTVAARLLFAAGSGSENLDSVTPGATLFG